MVTATNIRIYTSETAKHEGKSLTDAVAHFVRGLRISARCTVLTGRLGVYETGEISTDAIVDLSFHQPVIIDLLVPAQEADHVLKELQHMVHEGVIGVLPVSLIYCRPESSLLPGHLLVKDIMSAPPVVAHEDFTVRAVLEILLDSRKKSLPVVDAKGLVIGMVTTSDLIKAGMPVRTGLFSSLPEAEQKMFFESSSKTPVTSIMCRDLVTVGEQIKASEALRLLVERKKKRLPVVDKAGHLVGMLARIDLMRAISVELPQDRLEEDSASILGTSIRDVPKQDSIPVKASLDALEAIDVLVKQNEERAAVVDETGKLVGVISDRELLKALHKGGFGQVLRHLLQPGQRLRVPVAQIMVKSPISIRQDDSIVSALNLMIQQGLKRLPVVDEVSRFVGMVRRDALLIALSHKL